MSGRLAEMPESSLIGVVCMGSDALPVVAGVDTHKDAHELCVIDALGRKVREGALPATPSGYRDLADVIGGPGGCLVVGIEGTRSFGAGLTAHLVGSGFNVVEVLRPNSPLCSLGNPRLAHDLDSRRPGNFLAARSRARAPRPFCGASRSRNPC